MKRIDLSGKKFGRLSVLRFHGTKNGKAEWLCRCDCGSEKTYHSGNLKSGNTLSCGCYHNERIISENVIHGGKSGGKRTAAYGSWRAMLGRCLNPKNVQYENYGGRGIRVCKRWLKFENFLKDMGARVDGMTLDRIDNSGNYTPSNCKWSTKSEQANNTRTNRLLTLKNETRTQSQWASSVGIPSTLICQRLANGWTVERALTTPRRTPHSPFI